MVFWYICILTLDNDIHSTPRLGQQSPQLDLWCGYDFMSLADEADIEATAECEFLYDLKSRRAIVTLKATEQLSECFPTKKRGDEPHRATAMPAIAPSHSTSFRIEVEQR